MSYIDTPIRDLVKINQATDQTSVNSYELSYPTAVKYTNRPSEMFEIPKTDSWNSGVFHMLLNDAAGDSVNTMDADLTVWGFSPGKTGAIKLLVATITAGTGVLGTAASPGTSPVSSVTLTGQWAYAETIVLSVNNCNAYTKPATGDNGIAILRFDLIGVYGIFCDFDCDTGANTCDDALMIGRGI